MLLLEAMHVSMHPPVGVLPDGCVADSVGIGIGDGSGYGSGYGYGSGSGDGDGDGDGVGKQDLGGES